MKNKSKYVIELDEIQKCVYSFLKKEGFKKSGRSFNRETEDGIVEVITFQMGQFPIGKNWEVPGLRPNLYGKFTVNMGVYVDEIFSFKFPQHPPKIKKEQHCTFRTRLGTLINGRDYWWELKGQTTETSEELIMYFQDIGLNWFKKINTRNKIEQNGKERHKGAKLDIAIMLILNGNVERGKILFEEYYQSVDKEKIAYLNHLNKFRERLKIE